MFRKMSTRLMCAALGNRVERLKRIRIMNIRLGDLPEGAWREVSGEELAAFYRELKEERRPDGKTL